MLGDLLQKKKRYGAQCNSATMYDKEICRSVTRLYHRRTIRKFVTRGTREFFHPLHRPTSSEIIKLPFENFPAICPVLCFPTVALNIVLISMRKSKIGRKMQILRNCMELPSFLSSCSIYGFLHTRVRANTLLSNLNMYMVTRIIIYISRKPQLS